MKISREGETVVFELPLNEVHVLTNSEGFAGNTARIYRTLADAETMAFAIAVLSNEAQELTQAGIDADMGADEYRREKEC